VKATRAAQIMLFVTFGCFCWLFMQVVHEFGHVLGARATGGEVSKVALHPLILSRTDVGPNPHPLVVVWAGPVVGAVLPLLAWLAARACKAPGLYLFRAFAGFCLIANGLYIAAFPPVSPLDPGVMVDNGSPRWLLLLFGLVTVPSGFYLWHRQGEHFGLGESKGRVSGGAVVVSASLLLVVVAAELIANSR